MAAPRKFNKRSTAEDVVYGVDLARKTFMVTGANSGIGDFELHLLTYIHCMCSVDQARTGCGSGPGFTNLAARKLGTKPRQGKSGDLNYYLEKEGVE